MSEMLTRFYGGPVRRVLGIVATALMLWGPGMPTAAPRTSGTVSLPIAQPTPPPTPAPRLLPVADADVAAELPARSR
jgi:hypothetical protein